MTTEIELKYLILSDNTAEKITQVFNREKISFSYQEKQLTNCYFDTADLNLRQHDMGLRVRRCNNHIEQTIKTAGQVVGGLHSRPEYNVDIETTSPNLALFPSEIWQQSQSVSNIQNGLLTLFSTDFTRCTWLITDANNNVIELAYDHGEITSAEQQEPIDEIELELVKGDQLSLFNLASLLFKELALRPGLKSKAARGYALWRTEPVEDKTEQENFICDNRNDTIGNAFTAGLGRSLTSLQNSIECYLACESLAALVTIKTKLMVIRHGFWLFAKHLSPSELMIKDQLSHFVHLLSWVDNAIHLQELTNKTGNYRKKLSFSKQLIAQLKLENRQFPNKDDICQLLHSGRFNQLQLDLLQLYLARTETVTLVSAVNSDELIQFAQERIQFSLREISSQMKMVEHLNCQQYIAQSELLDRSLLTGVWLSGLFDSELRDKFRHPWLDLQQGISELQSLWIIQQQLEKLTEPAKKLVQWQQSKVESLLLALNNTKAIAIEMQPYWLESR